MSFHPLNGGFSSSLLGTATTPKIIHVENTKNDYYRRISNDKNKNTIFIIFVSAIIFVFVVSIYDIIRNAINNYYAQMALKNPKTKNTQQDIDNTIIVNNYSFNSSIVFGGVTLISVLIILIIYFYV